MVCMAEQDYEVGIPVIVLAIESHEFDCPGFIALREIKITCFHWD